MRRPCSRPTFPGPARPPSLPQALVAASPPTAPSLTQVPLATFAASSWMAAKNATACCHWRALGAPTPGVEAPGKLQCRQPRRSIPPLLRLRLPAMSGLQAAPKACAPLGTPGRPPMGSRPSGAQGLRLHLACTLRRRHHHPSTPMSLPEARALPRRPLRHRPTSPRMPWLPGRRQPPKPRSPRPCGPTCHLRPPRSQMSLPYISGATPLDEPTLLRATSATPLTPLGTTRCCPRYNHARYPNNMPSPKPSLSSSSDNVVRRRRLLGILW